MTHLKIATRVAALFTQAELQEDSQFAELLEKAKEQGFQLISGLFEENSGNVYHVLALSRNPEAWEPYRAPRFLANSDSYALWWYFDEELTGQNGSGNMIYELSNPYGLTVDGELAEEPNTLKYESGDSDGFWDMSPEDKAKVITYVQDVVAGKNPPRWSDPPRLN